MGYSPQTMFQLRPRPLSPLCLWILKTFLLTRLIDTPRNRYRKWGHKAVACCEHCGGLGWERHAGRTAGQRWWHELQIEIPFWICLWQEPMSTSLSGKAHALRSLLTSSCPCPVQEFAGSSCESGMFKLYANQREFRDQLRAWHVFKFSSSNVWLNGD